jgi:phenylalanyl-tRNA synthetase beta chain
MKLPLSLIKSYLPQDLSISQIRDTLTLLGVEVDAVVNEHLPFTNVVVGEILTSKKHPDAHNLSIAEVSDGSQTFTVVCGAPNCRAGLKTAFARIGAMLKEPNGTELHIQKTTIRGIESSGMLCSAGELGIFGSDEGILELPQDFKAGLDLSRILWNPIFELSLTPNLGHCMSGLGIARELSSGLRLPLFRPAMSVISKPAKRQFKVEIADEHLCPRYLCRLITGVRVVPSPFFFQKELEACGLKPINAIVDLANLAMMRTGQPFHAFDADRIEGDVIHVAPAKSPLTFTCLDDTTREIPTGTLLIADSKKPLAIAGVMGGAHSAINAQTTNILLEAAYFDPISIRNSAKKLCLRTESAHRFEKGTDIAGIEAALDELTAFILDICGGEASSVVDVKKGNLAPKQIPYRTSRVNQILGTKLSSSEVEEIFVRLGFKPRGEIVEVPLYRTDIQEETDLIEEVARIYGYNNIEKGVPFCSTSQISHDPVYVFETEVRRRLSGLGLQEVLTCDLISPKLAEISKQITPKEMEFLQSLYSKSEDYSILRTSLLPGMLNIVKGNLAQKNQSLHTFEIGRIHFRQNGKVTEIPMSSILLTGKAMPATWSQKAKDTDFFDLKGLIENLFSGIHLNVTFQRSNHMSMHPGRQADIHVGDLIVGSLGEVHPTLLERFDISQKVFYAELNLVELLEQKKQKPRMKPLPQFPASERDWTVSLDLETEVETIFRAVHSIKSPILEKVELIDLYKPEGATRRNLTFRFTYRDLFKTVSFDEVEAEHQKLLQAAEAAAK